MLIQISQMYAHLHAINYLCNSKVNAFFIYFMVTQPPPPYNIYVNTSGETQQTDETSSTIPEPEVVATEFSSILESSLDACCLFQQSFLRCLDFPQNQHFPLPFLSFDFDLEVTF
jgi:hypothetical protein